MKIITIILLFVMSANVYANIVLQYPLKTVSKLKCKRQDFDTMGEDCKQEIPILKTKYYNKYKNNSTYRNYYSVLWGGTYSDGWDNKKGSHLGIDIASAKNTPIYSIYEGKVVVAGYKYGRGNVVAIEHKINGKTVFSNYAHMTKILVKVGQKVKTGQQIGKMGSTGASSGNHLHFQIDLNDETRHPYRYAECSGLGSVVNKGLCRDGLLSNTIDPILFLETNGDILKNLETHKKNLLAQEKIQTKNDKKTITTKNNNIVKNKKTSSYKKDKIPEKTSKKKVITKKIIDPKKEEIRKFFKKYTFKVTGINVNKKLAIGDSYNVKIEVINRFSKKKYNGKLPGKLSIISSKGYTKISKKYFSSGDTIKVTGKREGKETIYIKVDNRVGKTIYLKIFDKNKKVNVYKANLVAKYDNAIGEENVGGVVMLDIYKNKLIKRPYKGKFELSGDGIKLCQYGKCNLGFKDKIVFEYEDTINGLVLFKYKTTKGKHNLKLKDISYGKKTIASTYIKGKIPKNISRYDKYYNEIISLLEEGVIDIKKGNFNSNEEIKEFEANKYIKNALLTMKNKEINPKILKKIDKKLNLLKKEKNSSKILSRKDFLEKIYKYLILIDNEAKISIKFKDLNEKENKIANMIFNNRYTFKERDSKKYYKPKQNIKKSEVAFMLNRALNINKDFLLTLR